MDPTTQLKTPRSGAGTSPARNNSARSSTTSTASTWRQASLHFFRPPTAMKREVSSLVRVFYLVLHHNSGSRLTAIVGRSALTFFMPSYRLFPSWPNSLNRHHGEPPSSRWSSLSRCHRDRCASRAGRGLHPPRLCTRRWTLITAFLAAQSALALTLVRAHKRPSVIRTMSLGGGALR